MSDDGLVRKDGYRRNRVDIPVGMVVTERHIVFAAVGSEGGDAGTLAYEEIAGIDVETRTLVITTTEGINWRFSPRGPDSDPVDIAFRHLCWIGEVRNRVVSMENDLELATGKIGALSADLDWVGALETYEEVRDRLDALINTVQWTTPLADRVLAPELTDLERRLESACARVFIDRSESQLELALQLMEYGDYEQARKVLVAAHEYYQRATWHTEEVKRADAFQFGRQRDLTHSLEELRWEMEAAAAEPLQAANEALVEAQTAEEVADEIERLEQALGHYRGAQTLASGAASTFEFEIETATADVEETASRLIDQHEREARTRWNEGSRLEAHDDREAALRECTVATEHLERAHELAEEFDPERASAFEARLRQMFEMLLRMQERANDGTDTAEAASDDPGEDSGDGTDTEDRPSLSGIPETTREYHGDLPTLGELTELDVHHDITLDLTGEGEPITDTESSEVSTTEEVEEPDGERRQSNETV